MEGERPTGTVASPLADVLTKDADEAIGAILRAARLHLHMEIAFVSEFREGRRVFRWVDHEAGEPCPVAVGGSDSLEDSYCARVVDGRLPPVIRDALMVPEAAALDVTAALPVGAHLSVPIKLADGRVYGTFCCFSTRPDPTLDHRDLAVMEMLAELVAQFVQWGGVKRDATDATRLKVTRAMAAGDPELVFQPIVNLRTGELVGVEALSRFASDRERGPATWFAEAWACGLGPELELTVLHRAIDTLAAIPRSWYLAVNCSPATVLEPGFPDVLERVGSDGRLVIEVTEHSDFLEYSGLISALEGVMDQGIRLAVDDVGTGYASLGRILELSPDIIKLDVSLTRGIEDEIPKQALVSAMVAFGLRVDAAIVAEGVETEEQLRTLQVLGVTHGQGYHFGRPEALRTVVAGARPLAV